MKLDWDYYSDQPAVIKDRKLKKEIYKKARWDSFKLLVSNLVIYPICLLNYWLSPIRKIDCELETFFGISINLDKNPEDTLLFINDLKAKNILIRMPLSDIENIQSYVAFAENYKNKNILINILQDRRHVEDPKLLKQSLKLIFSKFSPLTTRFQLGNAINRKKWAIFSMDEYLTFFKIGYDLKNEHYPNITLLGSSVIDFEYYFSIRTLFNWHKVKFDQFSSLLYVDRRGAPENKQMGLDLVGKLQLMQAILRLSPKSSNEIVITETNWPINNTFPYAPTSEEDCVSLETQADFLIRYYLLALTSRVVKNVYWHQLIAPGYGLIDNREEVLIKYPSYHAFKVMLSQLQHTNFVGTVIENGLYKAKFLDSTLAEQPFTIEVIWCNEPIDQSVIPPIEINPKTQSALSRDGTKLSQQSIKISGSPIYLTTALLS